MSFGAAAQQMLEQHERELIIADLREHRCKSETCPKTDKDECAVVAAIRYLTRNASYMDYQRFIAVFRGGAAA